jgi:hypothetical protein
LKLAQQAQQRIAQNSDRQNNSFVVSPEPANDQSTMMNFLSNVAVTQMKSTQENSIASSTVVTDNSDLRTFDQEPDIDKSMPSGFSGELTAISEMTNSPFSLYLACFIKFSFILTWSELDSASCIK